MAASFADLVGRRVGIYGLGVEGRASLAKLTAMGITPVLVDDRPDPAGPPGVLPTHGGGLEALGELDVVLKAPGISRYDEAIVDLASRGVEVRGGLGLWLAGVDPSTVICVTGTKGKSTTTSVLAHLLGGLGIDVLLAGNIGVVPWGPAVAPAQLTVVETSSFQVTDLEVGPSLVAVTSLGQDHLDWHRTLERYHDDKLSLLSLDGVTHGLVSTQPALLEAVRSRNLEVELCPPGALDVDLTERLGLVGAHNVANVAVARRLLEHQLGPQAPDRLLEAAVGFAPLESRFCRLEPLGGIEVIEDSLATNPLPTIAGIESLGDRRVALLVGGQDRGVDYQPLGDALAQRHAPTLLVAMPDNGARIAEACSAGNVEVVQVADLDEGVEVALGWAAPDGVVLLSPAAPSFGRFANYADRAAQFRAAIDARR